MKRYYQEKTPAPVERERALSHVQLTIRRDWAAGISGFNQWHNVEVDPEPLVLLDLNGAELFYEFTLRRGEKSAGAVKASASQTIGSPVVAVEIGPRRWDPNRAEKEAKEKARRQYPKAEITGTFFVCYSYPKVGVRVDLSEGNDRRSVIYDVGDLSEVPRFDDAKEGFAPWSFYERVVQPEEEKKLRRWSLADRELDLVAQRTPDVLARAFTDRETVKLRENLILEYEFAIAWYSSRVLKYGPRCSPHDCFMLYAQQTNVYCAVATGQMILDFHRWPFTQDEIATAMGTGATGTGNDGQVAGYESLTNNCFDATYDTSANWSEARAEIDANRPVKSGIPGHARACAGWKQQNIHLITQPPKRWLQIYDPWPWNADICQGGAVVWEDWDAVTHTNFIYVRHA